VYLGEVIFLLEEFLDQYQSKQTIKSYRSKLGLFLKFLEKQGKSIKQANVDDVYDFLDGKTLSTSNAYLNAIRSYYKYVTQLDLAIESFQVSTYRPDRNLKLSDAQKLVFGASNFRDKVLIKLALETGMRVQEIANLRMCDVVYRGRSYYVEFFAKGRKFRSIKISSSLAKLLKSVKSGEESIFGIKVRQIQRIIKKLGQDVLGFDVTPHMFRHCFATELMNQEVGFDSIREALGHENIMTTLKYLHNRRDKTTWDIDIKLNQ
jgi:integrase/recombinase XerD